MKKLLLIFIIFLINGCSPRYVVKTHYTSPSDSQGKMCLQSCSREQSICQANCNLQQEQCKKRAIKSAKELYPSVMQQYQVQLNQYQREMERYRLERRAYRRERHRLQEDYEYYQERCGSKKQEYLCSRVDELKRELRRLRRDEPYEPTKPQKPSLAQTIKEAEQVCSSSCGCQQAYDNCFVSCGGKLNYERFCVENCK